MKKKYFLNGNILDPHNSIEEMGGLIIGEDGKIEAIGKKVNKNKHCVSRHDACFEPQLRIFEPSTLEYNEPPGYF